MVIVICIGVAFAAVANDGASALAWATHAAARAIDPIFINPPWQVVEI